MSLSPDENSRVLEYFEERSGATRSLLERLVRIETPSGDAAALGKFVSVYRSCLEDAGVECEEAGGPAGPFLHGRLRSSGTDAREAGVVLVGHADTVWPVGEIARREPREEDGRLFAPGAYDMKAGLAVAAAALRFLHRRGTALRRPVSIWISPDEEIGSETAHPHMERLACDGDVALVLEPPLADGSLKAERKGVGMYRIEVEGREAHAGGDPGRGRSAVLELARIVVEIASWNDPEAGVLVNVGEIHGGVATNVVAGHASAGVDTRFDTAGDGEEIDRRLRGLGGRADGLSVSVKGGIIFPPLRPDARSREAAARAIRIAAGLGLRISAGKTGGGSDGSFLASRGLAVVDGLGVEGGGAHALDEHVVCGKLAVRAALLAQLVRELAG